MGLDMKKLVKKSQQPVVTNRTLNTTSPTSKIHYKPNKNIDVVSKEPIPTETYFRPNNYVIHKMDDIIKTKPLCRPHTTNMLDTDVTVDEKPQSFLTPRKHNQSATAPIENTNMFDQVQLVYNTLKC